MAEKHVLWTKTYTLLFLTTVLMWSGFSLMLSTMPLYVRHIGAHPSYIGIVIGIYPLAALLSRPFSGFAYDTIGRKEVFLVAMALFSFVTFGYIYSTTIILLVIVRIVQGLFFGVSTTGAATIVADIVHPSRIGEGVGYSGLGNTLAMAIGPAIGIWIMNAYGFMHVFLISGIVMSLAFVMSLFISYPKTAVQKKRLSINNVLEKSVLSTASLSVIVGGATGALLTFVIVFSKDIGLANGGIFFMLNAAGVALSRLFAGKVMDRQGPKMVLLIGFVVMAAGMVMLAVSREVILYGLSALVLGAGNGIVIPTIQAMVINMVSDDRRGAATATHFAAVDAGIGAGSIILGWISGFTSLATMFFICAALLIIPIFLSLFYVLKDYEDKALQVQAKQRPPVFVPGR